MTRFHRFFFVATFGIAIAVGPALTDHGSLAQCSFAQNKTPAAGSTAQSSSTGRAGSTATAPKTSTTISNKAATTATAPSTASTGVQPKSATANAQATANQSANLQSATPSTSTGSSTPATTSPSAANSGTTPVPQGIPNNDSASALQAQRLEKYLLKYKFAKGETLRTKVTQQTRVDTTIGGSSNVAEVATISQKSWRVVEVDKDGAVTFETQWDKIDMRQKMSGREEVRYNSETDKDPPAGYETTAASIGVPLSHLTISSNGKLLKREIKSDKAKPFMDEKATYQATQQLLVPLPNEPVFIGQPWSIPVDLTVKLESGPRAIQARHRYKIDKVESGVATISCETILPPLNDPELRSQLIQQMGTTKIEFDIAKGKVLSQVTDVDERVIGFKGNESSIHFLSRFTETLLTGDVKKTAAVQKPTAQTTKK